MKQSIDYHKYQALCNFTATLAAIYSASVLLETVLSDVHFSLNLSTIAQFVGAVLDGMVNVFLQWGLALPMLLSEIRYLIAGDEFGLYITLSALQIAAAYWGAKLARVKNRSMPNWAAASFFLPWISPFILVKLSERPRKSLAMYGYPDEENGDNETG